MKNSEHKRRIRYIKKKYQRGFIVRFCLVAVGAMALASLLVYLFSGDSLTASYRYHRLTLVPTSQAIVPSLLASNLAVLAAFLAVTVYFTLYISHKIAGPMYRFEQDLKTLATGDLAREFRLRHGDQLEDVITQLNNTRGDLRAKVEMVKQKVRELEDRAGQGAPGGELQKALAELGREMDEMFTT